MRAECQAESHRSAGTASSIHCNKVGRATGSVEAHFACVRAAALIIGSNRGQARNTRPRVDRQHGVEDAADRVDRAQAIGWSGPFPPNRFRGCLPGMGRLPKLGGGVVVRTGDRGGSASERLGIGKCIVGDCGPCRLHDGECDPPLLLSVAIHRDLIGCADRGIEGHLAGVCQSGIIVFRNEREVSHAATRVNSEHRIERTAHKRNCNRRGSRRRPCPPCGVGALSQVLGFAVLRARVNI